MLAGALALVALVIVSPVLWLADLFDPDGTPGPPRGSDWIGKR